MYSVTVTCVSRNLTDIINKRQYNILITELWEQQQTQGFNHRHKYLALLSILRAHAEPQNSTQHNYTVTGEVTGPDNFIWWLSPLGRRQLRVWDTLTSEVFLRVQNNWKAKVDLQRQITLKSPK